MRTRLILAVLSVCIFFGSTSGQTVEELIEEIQFLKEKVYLLEKQVKKLQQAEQINSNHEKSTAPMRLTSTPVLTSPSIIKDYPTPTPNPTLQQNSKLPEKLPEIEILSLVRTDLFGNTDFKFSSTFLRKIEIAFAGKINDWIGFKVELDPARPNDPFRRTFMQFTPHKYVDVRVGQEKAPLGMEELMKTSRIPFADRSDVSDRFAPAEELGLITYFGSDKIKLGFSLTDGRKRQKIENQRDDNDSKDITGRIAFAPLDWVELGVARMDGRFGTGELKRNRTNLSFRFADRNNVNAFLYGEYFNADDGAVSSDAFHVAVGKGFKLKSKYIDTIVPALRYEILEQDGPAELLDELEQVTFGLNFWLQRFSAKVAVNYIKDLKNDGFRDQWRFLYQFSF